MQDTQYLHRKRRIRAKIFGTQDRPRLSVYKSNKNIFAQIINDEVGKTLAAVSSKEKELESAKNRTEAALALGELLAKKAIAAKVKKVVFDKGAYRYHGIVKGVAEGARKGGLDL